MYNYITENKELITLSFSLSLSAASFLLGYKPYLLTHAMTHWNMSSFTRSSLSSRFADSRVDYYPHNMREETVRPFFASLGEGEEGRAHARLAGNILWTLFQST